LITKQQEYAKIKQEINTTLEKIIANYALPTYTKSRQAVSNTANNEATHIKRKLPNTAPDTVKST
jgi:hypothetical protein